MDFSRVRKAIDDLESDSRESLRVAKTSEHSEETLTWVTTKYEHWDNSLSGIAGGYALESKKALEYLAKGRIVNSSRGDITTTSRRYIINTQPRGKVVQLKLTYSETRKAVKAALTKALEQISGKFKEKPNIDDVKVVEIVIANAQNSWPLAKTLGKLWVENKVAISLELFEDTMKILLSDLNAKHNFPIFLNRSNAEYTLEDSYMTEHKTPFKRLHANPFIYPATIEEEVISSAEILANTDIESNQPEETDTERAPPDTDNLKFIARAKLLIKINYVGERMFKHSGLGFCSSSKVVFSVNYDAVRGIECEIDRRWEKLSLKPVE